jgi:hypothetical protein
MKPDETKTQFTQEQAQAMYRALREILLVWKYFEDADRTENTILFATNSEPDLKHALDIVAKSHIAFGMIHVGGLFDKAKQALAAPASAPAAEGAPCPVCGAPMQAQIDGAVSCQGCWLDAQATEAAPASEQGKHFVVKIGNSYTVAKHDDNGTNLQYRATPSYKLNWTINENWALLYVDGVQARAEADRLNAGNGGL